METKMKLTGTGARFKGVRDGLLQRERAPSAPSSLNRRSGRWVLAISRSGLLTAESLSRFTIDRKRALWLHRSI